MDPVEFIQQIDFLPNIKRRENILIQLKHMGVSYQLHQIEKDRFNIIVDLGAGSKRLAFSSHYDIVEGAGGANDNGSGVAVCLEIIRQFVENKLNSAIRIIFFDMEEEGMIGSFSYVFDFVVDDISGLINLDLVGTGNNLAIWPVNPDEKNFLIKKIEASALANNIKYTRLEHFITDIADHIPFQAIELVPAYTLSMLTDEDLEALTRYNATDSIEVKTNYKSYFENYLVLGNYHKVTDDWTRIDEGTIQVISKTLFELIDNLSAFD